jgi:hypothetical protein
MQLFKLGIQEFLINSGNYNPKNNVHLKDGRVFGILTPEI